MVARNEAAVTVMCKTCNVREEMPRTGICRECWEQRKADWAKERTRRQKLEATERRLETRAWWRGQGKKWVIGIALGIVVLVIGIHVDHARYHSQYMNEATLAADRGCSDPGLRGEILTQIQNTAPAERTAAVIKEHIAEWAFGDAHASGNSTFETQLSESDLEKAELQAPACAVIFDQYANR